MLNNDLAKEPEVELILARYEKDKPAPDGNYSFLKNPRVWQFASNVAGARRVYSISIHDRWWAPRRILSNSQPFGQLETDLVRLLGQWLGRRYDRASFPDEFNSRHEAVEGAITAELRKGGVQLTALFVSVSDSELPAAVAYEISVIGTMEPSAYADPTARYEAERTVQRIAALFDDCPGIDVIDHLVASEAEVTLDDVRRLRRWEQEHLSHRPGRAGSVAPRP